MEKIKKLKNKVKKLDELEENIKTLLDNCDIEWGQERYLYIKTTRKRDIYYFVKKYIEEEKEVTYSKIGKLESERKE